MCNKFEDRWAMRSRFKSTVWHNKFWFASSKYCKKNRRKSVKVCLHSIWRIFLQFLSFQILEVFHRKLVRTACMQKGGKTKNLLLLYNCVCLFVHFAKARKRRQTWLSFRSQVKITNMLVELCFASAHTKESENHRVGLTRRREGGILYKMAMAATTCKASL